jgi:hypothetical protein
MDWRALKATIDAENDRIVDEPPAEVVKVVQYRIVDSGAGTDGNIMGTWFYALTDERYVVASLYQIILSAGDPSFTVAQLKYMARVMLPKVTEFVGYCGFHKLWEFMEATLEAMDQIESREDLLELLNSMFVYASHINAWIHHYFPWNIAYTFPHRTAEEVREMARLLDEE